MENRKILVITHQLSRTGAPIVLMDVIRIYRKQGYEIEVITMLDGKLREVLNEMNIQLKVQERFYHGADAFLEYAKVFDLVIVNTLIAYEAIHVLKNSNIQVLWWLHEGRQYFEHFASVLPDFKKLPSNIHVFSVSHYVQRIVKELYDYTTEILHFGVEDIPRTRQIERKDSKIRFLTVGTYSKVKAQDVLVKAIRMLPQSYQNKTEFIFCGNEKVYDETIYFSVKQLAEEFSNVTMRPLIIHEEMLQLMEKSACVIVSSRIEPVPTVAVEMMMKENLCICTDICGVAYYIEDGINGFTVPTEDVQALSEKIKYVIEHYEKLDSVRINGRKTYEKHFSNRVIEEQILQLTERYTMIKNIKLPVSVCMITKNEEQNIERCLKQLQPYNLEIVIVDTGSTDGTKEIARKYTENIYDFVWCDDFAAAKNYAISKASNAYVLILDSDEFVEDIDMKKLQELLEGYPDKVGRIHRRNVFIRKGEKQENREWINRVFAKDLYCYEGRIHEQVRAIDKEDYATYEAPIEILHTGYDLSEAKRREKAKRNIKLLESEQIRLEKEADTQYALEQLPYILYQLGKSYYMAEEYERACEYFAKGLSYDLNPKLEYVIDMVETYGYALINSNRASEALFFENIYEEFGNNADFQFLMGLIYMNNMLFEEAISEFLKATTHKTCRADGVNAYRAYYNVGVIQECLGNHAKAKEAYQQCGKYEAARKRLEMLEDK